ncbi:Predicted pyrophosphatase or phosphodiesterase, AlkP superfamily [Tessaracoccus bendigoensis DSM 12906]|uniref:Predicted pyrophosphatase or phosphodiesterase, AlkP superfamily n=1 Tax=Tessaracoccus bendigoensis DSM 12906 TaxID=1123357 RepID=A0A1M6MJH0_9ACTN|nr:nucleotide pyrophosphatase/phosphodiesterase family protein [Tessaracoccus bendigoensis]SHJ83597.1 Predicted pyrophosphatase or phosphodiesterase, AlkP superfamily [Tessaracoccus bendigoensis DSM 12906]
MSEKFVEPRYEDLALTHIFPSVLARLEGATPVLDLPSATKYVVLLVDGLGWHQLLRHGEHAETMADAMAGAPRLTCSVPSTTATSLTSLGTGCPTGEHGIVGYTFFEPTVSRVINALTWEGGPSDVTGFAQVPTVFQRLASIGRGSGTVTLDRFAGSALTRLAFAGTTHFPVSAEGDPEQFVKLVEDALRGTDVVYCYERMLDHDGHGHGVGSWQWLDRLGLVDDMVAHLSDSLPPDVCLLVTGDHGMVNVPEDARIVIENEPRLGGCSAIGGEPRFRHVYGDKPRELAWAWESVLGERGVVMRREEAIEAGWFGPQTTGMSRSRIGDVVVAMTADHAAMSTATPGEFGLVGMHGSLTAAEMEVPLLSFGGSR